MKQSLLRALIEIGFIVFLFYANLLMGEYERSGIGQKNGFMAVLVDVFTVTNAGIAIAAALVGYVIFEFLRRKY